MKINREYINVNAYWFWLNKINTIELTQSTWDIDKQTDFLHSMVHQIPFGEIILRKVKKKLIPVTGNNRLSFIASLFDDTNNLCFDLYNKHSIHEIKNTIINHNDDLLTPCLTPLLCSINLSQYINTIKNKCDDCTIDFLKDFYVKVHSCTLTIFIIECTDSELQQFKQLKNIQ